MTGEDLYNFDYDQCDERAFDDMMEEDAGEEEEETEEEDAGTTANGA